MGEWTPGYTANRAVNAVPFVCRADPGIRTSGGPAPGHRNPTTGARSTLEHGGRTDEASARTGTGHRVVLDLRCRRSSAHPGVHGSAARSSTHRSPICPVCRSRRVGSRRSSRAGAPIIGYTVNHHQWSPHFVPPYAIAVVALAEDPGVRLTTTHRGVRSRRGGTSARKWSSGSSTTRTCGSRCSSSTGAGGDRRPGTRRPSTPGATRRRWATTDSSTVPCSSGVGTVGAGSTADGRSACR